MTMDTDKLPTIRINEITVKPLNFYSRMTDELQEEVKEYLCEVLTEEDRKIVSDLSWLLEDVYRISEKQAEQYKHTSDDYYYWNFMHLFSIIQPTMEYVIADKKLYEKYPEYLV